MSPYLLNLFQMIAKETISLLTEEYLDKESLFLVNVEVSIDNDIVVTIESPDNVDIRHCAELSRIIEQGLDREKEDFSLTVTSAGLDMPFKVLKQYHKFLGEEVEIILKKGTKFIAKLIAADETSIQVSRSVKVKEEGVKKAVTKEITEIFNLSDLKSTKPFIKFK